ncbi:hypothetical protein HPB49_007131 [Dermacentor silvarum]|uniref:Uncharacterized protein n=1 Tax=Dermacentor silvarum TaxID=543639 RepID=A0ACB8CJU4_DERSI|nr:hypothetical protein HPB49_007131 [Dermacentor silvarum]
MVQISSGGDLPPGVLFAQYAYLSDRTIISLGLLVTFFILLLVISVGVVLAFYLGEPSSTTEVLGEAEARPGTDLGAKITAHKTGRGRTVKEPYVEPMAPEVRIPVPAQDSQTSVALPISQLFRKNFCDYIVYPDLVAQGGEFVPLLGKVSWNVFQAAFANAVSQQRHTEPMTFLGVWLYKEATAREFASEVATMTHINTIIIQTHISVPFRAGHTCISRPICAMAASDLRPSFEVAQQAESFLRSRGDKFRIVFSSTLGVMVYVGQAFRKQPSGPYDACDSSYMAGRDFLCSGGTTSLGLEMYDKDEMYTYVIYQDGSNQHFVTYETTNSLLDKRATMERIFWNCPADPPTEELQKLVGLQKWEPLLAGCDPEVQIRVTARAQEVAFSTD